MSTSLEKSRKFALKIYGLYKYLCDEKCEFELAKQILRSGISIGVNLNKVKNSINMNEFLRKQKSALNGCVETEVWLNFFKEISLITSLEYENLNKDCHELLRLLTASTNTLQKEKNKHTV